MRPCLARIGGSSRCLFGSPRSGRGRSRCRRGPRPGPRLAGAERLGQPGGSDRPRVGRQPALRSGTGATPANGGRATRSGRDSRSGAVASGRTAAAGRAASAGGCGRGRTAAQSDAGAAGGRVGNRRACFGGRSARRPPAPRHRLRRGRRDRDVSRSYPRDGDGSSGGGRAGDPSRPVGPRPGNLRTDRSRAAGCSSTTGRRTEASRRLLHSRRRSGGRGFGLRSSRAPVPPQSRTAHAARRRGARLAHPSRGGAGQRRPRPGVGAST